MTGTLVAGFWGLVGGAALLLGAAIAYLVAIPPRVVAGVMAFGSGVLISALSFELMEEAAETGGLLATGAGFLAGAAAYTATNVCISRRGGHDRKRSGEQQRGADEGGGLALAVGALLDGVPESMVIGLSLLSGQGVSLVAVAAVFLSNVPEGLSSVAGMRKAGAAPLATSSASGAGSRSPLARPPWSATSRSTARRRAGSRPSTRSRPAPSWP